MVALLMLYPGLSAVKLVGTDLVQAVPLVLAAAISNIVVNHGLDWGLTIPLIIGSVPGTILGSRIAPRVPQSFIRRGIVVVLTMSGVALLDKAGWAPLGVEETHPLLIGGVGLAMIVLVPLIWGLLRKEQGLPMFGAPTVAELEDPTLRADPRPRRATTRLTAAAVHLLDNPIRDYAWGSTYRAGRRSSTGSPAVRPRPSCGSARTPVTRRGCRTAAARRRDPRPAAADRSGPTSPSGSAAGCRS